MRETMLRTVISLVLLLCLICMAEAQVNYEMLENDYPGPDLGWLPLVFYPPPPETVQLEIPLIPGDHAELPPRVIIHSGPVTIIFNLDGTGTVEQSISNLSE